MVYIDGANRQNRLRNGTFWQVPDHLNFKKYKWSGRLQVVVCRMRLKAADFLVRHRLGGLVRSAGLWGDQAAIGAAFQTPFRSSILF